MKRHTGQICLSVVLTLLIAAGCSKKPDSPASSGGISTPGGISSQASTESSNTENETGESTTSGNTVGVTSATQQPSNSHPATSAGKTESPTTTASSASVPSAASKKLTVMSDAYSWFGAAYKGAVPAKKGEKYGLIDLKGKVLVPFEYDAVRGMSPDGHLVAWKKADNPFGEVAYIFDSKGNKLWETDDMDVQTCYEGIVVARSELSYDENEDPTGYTVYLLTPKGKKIAEFPDVDSFSGASEGYIVLHDYHGPWYVVDKTGKTVTSKKIFKDDAEPNALNRTQLVSNGLINGYFSKSNIVDHSTIVSRDFSKIYSFIGHIASSAGTLFTIHGDRFYDPTAKADKYYLFDAAKMTTAGEKSVEIQLSEALRQTGYDSISLNAAEPYFLVSRDGKMGFLSRDGKTEKLFDDAGRFAAGKAIVMEGKKAYIIDSNFRRLSQEVTGYDAVATLGENAFCLYKGDAQYLAIYS